LKSGIVNVDLCEPSLICFEIARGFHTIPQFFEDPWRDVRWALREL
jgi:hypothetical protein